MPAHAHRTASPGREARPSACSSGFGLCRPSCLRFISSRRSGSAPVCALKDGACRPQVEWRLPLVYAPPPDVSWDCDRYDTYRNEAANSHQARGAYRHRTAQRTRRGRHQNATSCYSLVCGVSTVLIIRIMIRSASEQALLSARPPLSRLFQSELHASFPSASHPPTGQGLEVASRLYSRLAAPSCPVPNDMLVASKCT